MDGSLLGYGIEELSEICEAVFRASFSGFFFFTLRYVRLVYSNYSPENVNIFDMTYFTLYF